MIRKASIMQVHHDKHAEYKKRHDEIFPDLVKELKAHGAHNYSIFLDSKAACQKWWAFMQDIMPSNSDNSPISESLTEVFYLL